MDVRPTHIKLTGEYVNNGQLRAIQTLELVQRQVKRRINKHKSISFPCKSDFTGKNKPECHHLHQISHGSLGRQCQHWWQDAPQSQIGSQILGLNYRSKASKGTKISC